MLNMVASGGYVHGGGRTRARGVEDWWSQRSGGALIGALIGGALMGEMEDRGANPLDGACDCSNPSEQLLFPQFLIRYRCKEVGRAPFTANIGTASKIGARGSGVYGEEDEDESEFEEEEEFVMDLNPLQPDTVSTSEPMSDSDPHPVSRDGPRRAG